MGLVAVALLSGCGGDSESSTIDAPLKVGQMAPTTIQLPKLGSPGTGSLEEYQGQWVLVNFWASWCKPCQSEAIALAGFQEEHGGAAFTVVGINSKDPGSGSIEFAQQHDFPYPQLRDEGAAAAGQFETTGIPESFLLEPTGKLAWHGIGGMDMATLEAEVAPLLPRR